MQFALQYVTWHYSRAIRDTIVLWSNIIWFLSNFFSLPLLSSTLFSPWKRLHEKRSEHFDIEDFMSVIVVNVMMRLVGFLFRITIIAIGLIVLTLALILMGIHLLIWIFFPLVVTGLVYYGTSLLFV